MAEATAEKVLGITGKSLVKTSALRMSTHEIARAELPRNHYDGMACTASNMSIEEFQHRERITARS
jgi:hypothetical protein